jgi:hypothetical protein
MFRLQKLFTEHPNESGESYFTHAGFAFGVGLELALICLIVLTHAILPMCFKRTGGQRLLRLMEKLQARSVRA